jgi:predicted hydrocarbon binding protein
VKKGWKTLDLLEHTERAIHTVVRRQTPGADPPRLSCVRSSPDEAVVIYTSSRRMCPVAKGIIQGVAAHFQERIRITEAECMLKGDPHCTMSVRLLPPARAAEAG